MNKQDTCQNSLAAEKNWYQVDRQSSDVQAAGLKGEINQEIGKHMKNEAGLKGSILINIIQDIPSPSLNSSRHHK